MTAARRSTVRRSSAKRAAQVDEDTETKPAPRRGAKRTVLGVIRQIPSYLKLLMALMRDPRVSPVDKLLVAGAIVYIVSPLDLIPDFIPFFGEVDDIYLLMLALQRLMKNAGRAVLADHWTGDPRELSDLNVQRVYSAAAFFLPRAVRNGLKRMIKR